MVLSIDIPCEEDAIQEILDQFDEDKDNKGTRVEEEEDEENEHHLDKPVDHDDKESGDKHFQKVSKMYIKDRTRGVYNATSNEYF